ncbi:MAG TPA: WecB/TagA/CpsF family glycosyltransferase [Steroidobacteraceae bacterium]|nr:WecB/TagA/CpsF family glycosyltransferase [Steroidobacteraceae bacterium]
MHLQTTVAGAAYAPAGRLDDAKQGARDLVHLVDDFDQKQFLAVAAAFGQRRYGFVVTPNVDHLIRLHEDPSFRALYRSAEYVLMDSRFFARVLRLLKGIRLPVCTGSDLSEGLLAQVAAKSDRIVMVGGSAEQAQRLAALYGLTNLRHHSPPMGFIEDPLAVEECLQFIESESPFRFCFLALGSPQQEMLAQLLLARGAARGLALCVGASLNFITGVEKRAPLWMQRASLEWLHRLWLDPRRLAGRYLVRGPRIFSHLRRARFVLRNPSANSG